MRTAKKIGKTVKSNMNFFFISPIGVTTPSLYNTFEKPFSDNGHRIVNSVGEADVVFFDLHSRIHGYDLGLCSEVLRQRKPVVIFDATDYGAMSKEVWVGRDNWTGLLQYNNQDWAKFLHGCVVLGLTMVYFMRKMNKTLQYPDFVHPLELIAYPDHEFEVTTKDELFERPYDICFIGNTSPTRANLVIGLLKYKTFTIDCEFISGERIPHNEWLNRHRQAKLFIECCGGGFGSERIFQLHYIAGQLRNKSNMLRLNDFTDEVNCLEVSEIPTDKEVEKLLLYLNNKDKLYDLYLNGISHIKQYFNAEQRAIYVLGVIKNILS